MHSLVSALDIIFAVLFSIPEVCNRLDYESLLAENLVHSIKLWSKKCYFDPDLGADLLALHALEVRVAWKLKNVLLVKKLL